ncbi:MAG TPA: phage major tail protein, TP901-1 family [Hellea balneolensis]|uniref:Phage major tail protein, TP901-1 family n=1 Tax=Hellea balneolensis TaxID=287478 RepID=A0A7C5LTX3_9PROT|nr:phage major tail protein, TP901-1 family [Hellea balneolensis]
MAAQRGRDLLIKVSTNGSYKTVAGLRSKSIKFNAKLIDITHSESDAAWRELLPGAGVKSVELTGAGVFFDAESDGIIRQGFFDQSIMDMQIIIPDFGSLTGPFLVASLNYAGSYNGEASYEITLVSAGRPVFAAL